MSPSHSLKVGSGIKNPALFSAGCVVGNTGFEPVTPALSRRCSKPTELIARGRQMYEQSQKCAITQNQSCESLLDKKL